MSLRISPHLPIVRFMSAEGPALRSEKAAGAKRTFTCLDPPPAHCGGAWVHRRWTSRTTDGQLTPPRRRRSDGLKCHVDELRQLPAAAHVVTTRPSDEQTVEPGQFPGAVLADIDAVPIGLGDRVGCL